MRAALRVKAACTAGLRRSSEDVDDQTSKALYSWNSILLPDGRRLCPGCLGCPGL